MQRSHECPVTSAASDLVAAVDDALPKLLAISDADAARRPAPGRWSRKEIVGHLIDSAFNNHQRFVRAQLQEALVFPGYEQDDWVRVQRYQERPWRELVELWRALNLHLAEVIRATPERERTRPRLEHNLGEIAWGEAPNDGSATLDWFQHDYVGHLRHHLAQALGS
jgi:hypothetical protein